MNHSPLPISLVVTTLNSERKLESTLQSVQGIVSELILVDAGSTDKTLSLGQAFGCKIIHEQWHGYGQNKNIGIRHSKHEWILALDSDEALSASLRQYFMEKFDLQDLTKVYKIKINNYLGDHHIKHGTWGNTFSYRLFAKSVALWDESKVHEKIVYDRVKCSAVKIDQPVLHYTSDTIRDFQEKLTRYALESAIKNQHAGIRGSNIKAFFSAFFSFVKDYILKIGILDGKDGFDIAWARSKANFHKYIQLKRLNKQANK